MKKLISLLLSVVMMFVCGVTMGCDTSNKEVKIGASFGIGDAPRWAKEEIYMKDYAEELGVSLETRLNRHDKPKTQEEDCREMIDSGIDVLILMPRDASDVDGILDYAKKKKVKVISYARVILDRYVDLFVGYDSEKVGKTMGKHLAEASRTGDYIILRGAEGDNNATLLYKGAMSQLSQPDNNINIIADQTVANWDAKNVEPIVRAALEKNNNHVDAILACNDTLAGAAAKVLEDMNVQGPVFITGMDADIEALRRIVAGKQSMTVYLDLKELAIGAVDQACRMARKLAPTVTEEFANGENSKVNAFLINGKEIIKQNIKSQFIDTGIYTYEDIYGEAPSPAPTALS